MISEDLFMLRRDFEKQLFDTSQIKLNIKKSGIVLDVLDTIIEQVIALENAVVPDAERVQEEDKAKLEKLIEDNKKVVRLDYYRIQKASKS